MEFSSERNAHTQLSNAFVVLLFPKEFSDLNLCWLMVSFGVCMCGAAAPLTDEHKMQQYTLHMAIRFANSQSTYSDRHWGSVVLYLRSSILAAWSWPCIDCCFHIASNCIIVCSCRHHPTHRHTLTHSQINTMTMSIICS